VIAKRAFDLLVASLGLILLVPPFLLIAIWIKIDSAGPVFFRQERVGRFGKIFRIHKFRTMVTDAEVKGPQLTVGTDARITRSGRFLRNYKLDELPQLIDVIHGDMSLVGPRPEVPRYVAFYPEDMRNVVLSVRPGITDFAAIEFKNESQILSGSPDPEQAYVRQIMPIKLQHYRRYVETQSVWLDLVLILRTLKALFH
jgi:lipopolysaccharide/colanic/teichoic acid biosynthesis glycosyltransferase